MAWKLQIEQNQTNPAILWQETLHPNFTDATGDIVALDKHGKSKIGYKRTRDLISAAVMTDTNNLANWNTYAHQSIAIRWVCVPYAMRVPTISESEDLANWNLMADATKEGREEIIEIMRIRVSDELRKETLTKTDLDNFWDDTFTMINSYMGANSPDFKNWLIGDFSTKTYWSQSLEDDLLNIYNGYY